MEEQTKRRRLRQPQWLRWPRVSLRSLVLLAAFSGAAWTTWYHWKPWVLVREAQVPETLAGLAWSGSISSVGDSLVVRCYGNTMFQIWDLDAARPVLSGTCDSDIFCDWVDPEKTHALVQTQTTRTTLWDVRAQRPIKDLAGIADFLLGAWFLDDGRRLVTLEKDALRVFNSETGEGLATIAFNGKPASRMWPLPGREEAVVLFEDFTLGIQPLIDGAALAELPVKAVPVFMGGVGVQVSAKGASIAVRGLDGQPGAIVDVATRTIRRRPEFFDGPMFQFCRELQQPFGNKPANVWVVKGEHGEVEVLDADTLEVKCRPGALAQDVGYIQFSGDGRRLLLYSSDGFQTASLWDLESGANLPTVLDDHNAAFAMDPSFERLVYLWGMSREIQIMSTRTGEILDSLGPIPQISSEEELNFTADGRRLYSIDVQNHIRVWERRRKETSWGAFGLVDTWVAAVLLAALVVSLWNDRRYFAAREARNLAQALQSKVSAPALPAGVRPAAEAKTPTA